MSQTFFHQWLMRIMTGSKRSRGGQQRRPIRLALEALEDRALPSTIVWVNEGGAGGDFDYFETSYGAANAELARAVVHAAIRQWENVIDDFNYANVGTVGNAP